MSVTYGFYNSMNGDRKYNATQLSFLFDGIIRDGVFMTVGNKFVVLAAKEMTITVDTGRAWFNRTWTDNDSKLPLVIETPEVVLDRIDAVVLEVNTEDSTRANTFKIIKGTPSSFPVRPTLIKSEKVNQYPIAYIRVGAGVFEIRQADITNTVGTSECPFVTGILETVNADHLLLQWDDQFNTWLTDTRRALTRNTAGKVIYGGTAVIPTTGWIQHGGDNPLKINISIPTIDYNNWVDILIDKEYQDVANEANINPTVDEYAGGITIYANQIPTEEIPIKYRVLVIGDGSEEDPIDPDTGSTAGIIYRKKEW